MDGYHVYAWCPRKPEVGVRSPRSYRVELEAVVSHSVGTRTEPRCVFHRSGKCWSELACGSSFSQMLPEQWLAPQLPPLLHQCYLQ